MKKFIPVIFAIVILSCGRTEKSLPVLDFAAAVNRGVTDTFTLNNLAERIEYIPIETTDDFLLSYATLIHIDNDHIYGRDIESTIFRLDRNGRLVNHFTRTGRGPGEYLRISSIDVSSKDSVIRVFDLEDGNKYIIYDMYGNLIKETSTEEMKLGRLAFMSDDYFIMTGSRTNPGDHRLYITDDELNIRRELFPIDPDVPKVDRMILNNQASIFRYGDALLYFPFYADTVYTVTDAGAEPLFILNMGEYRHTNNMATTLQYGMGSFPPYVQTFFLREIPGYYFIDYRLEGVRYFEIWNKTDMSIVSRSRSGFLFRLPSGKIVRSNPTWIEGNTIALTITGAQAAGEIKGVGEDDNPVVVILTMKE